MLQTFCHWFRLKLGCLVFAAGFLTDLNIYVVVVYRPPSNTALHDEHLLSLISNFYISREVVLLGYFNLPS